MSKYLTLRVYSLFAAVILMGCSNSKRQSADARPDQGPAEAAEVVVEPGDISGRHSYNGDLIVKGSILKGSEIEVVNGGVRVEGGLEDNVSINQRNGKGGGNTITVINGSASISSSGGVTIINGSRSGRVIYNGVDITDQVNKAQAENKAPTLSGIEVHGNSGDNVSLKSTESIAGRSFGEKARIDAGGSFAGGNIGNNANIDTGGSAAIGSLGDNSHLDTGGSINAGNIGGGAFLDAGGSINAGNVGPKAKLDAGGSINLGVVSKSAKLDAGGSVNVSGSNGRSFGR